MKLCGALRTVKGGAAGSLVQRHQPSLWWPDLGFARPVSVSCIYFISFLFFRLNYRSFFFLKKEKKKTNFEAAWERKTRRCIFSVFRRQKHAAYREFYLSLCPYGDDTIRCTDVPICPSELPRSPAVLDTPHPPPPTTRGRQFCMRGSDSKAEHLPQAR